MNPETFYRELVETLRLLASDANIQRAVLPEFVDVPLEIAQLSDDMLGLLDQIIEIGWITPEFKQRYLEFDKRFTLMSADDADDTIWTLEGLSTSREWSAIRRLAGSLLDELHEGYHIPNLFWFQFIPLDGAKFNLEELVNDDSLFND